MKKTLLTITLSLLFMAVSGQKDRDTSDARFRPLLHFTPKAHWMNDPNGMVFYKGVYHLFYQFYPGGNVWGPMHWGHATSKDLVQWHHEPIALFPDSLGMIFSGSAVVDKDNTSGFGVNGKTALVAIFTQHNEDARLKGAKDFQQQSIAYSLDEGKTWIKYKNNPVLKSSGLVDFRDPKVSWNTNTKKWIMTLAVADRVHFYSSPDLKNWTKESEFGETAGAHGGVWECPDLFSMKYQGKEIWVLLVSMNPGGPNEGSATQYFLGDFDGKTFHPYKTDTRWIDYGPDNYAGVTWSNTGDKRFFMGWMSNWSYAQQVPTYTWRSAMTITRELRIEQTSDGYLLTQHTDQLLDPFFGKGNTWDKRNMHSGMNLIRPYDVLSVPCRIQLLAHRSDVSVTFADAGEGALQIGYDDKAGQYYIDRTKAGISSFFSGFAKKATAPRIARGDSIQLTILLDRSSVELLADDGKTVMTSVFFPQQPFTKAVLQFNEAYPVSATYAPFRKK